MATILEGHSQDINRKQTSSSMQTACLHVVKQETLTLLSIKCMLPLLAKNNEGIGQGVGVVYFV